MATCKLDEETGVGVGLMLRRRDTGAVVTVTMGKKKVIVHVDDDAVSEKFVKEVLSPDWLRHA